MKLKIVTCMPSRYKPSLWGYKARSNRHRPYKPRASNGPSQQQSEGSAQVPLKVVRVEDESVFVSGVAKVDRGESAVSSEMKAIGKVATLIAGDIAALLLFTLICRVIQNETLDANSLLLQALPSLVAWFSAGGALGAFGKASRGYFGSNQALEPALKAW